MNTDNIVTGERIQNITDTYIGYDDDFLYNPFIDRQQDKHETWPMYNDFNNKSHIFCYGHNVVKLSLVIHLFRNPFVLVTHNSDQNIDNTPAVNRILSDVNVVRWYAQNVNYHHPKLHFVPIGIANSMWDHGNLSLFERLNTNEKTHDIYMYFDIYTNHDKRIPCMEELSGKVEFLPKMGVRSNLERMAKYRYCICPEGNGLDTHRLWEAYYLRMVPIVLRSTHTEIIEKQCGLPMILLDKWGDLNVDSLPPYESFDFERGSQYLDITSTLYKNIRSL